jgi:two-component system, NtrC family, sensor kinase
MPQRGGSEQPVKGRRATRPKARNLLTAAPSMQKQVGALTLELQETREQQTATANVLKVISRSAFDLQAVLQTLVESAARLCDADMAQITRQRDGVFFRAEAYGFPEQFIEYSRTIPVAADRGSAIGRALLEGTAIHIPDALADPEYTFTEGQRLADFRAVLAVPMLRDGTPIGVIVMTRKKARPFTQKQIELATTFADQAVIAIENARLLSDLRQRTDDLSESLQQQTATAEVLKVISRSAFDLETVLDALLSSACRLCEADIGTIRYKEGGEFRLAATFGCKPEWIEHFQRYSTKPDRSSVFGRTIAEGHIVHIPDLLADPDYKRPEAQKLMGFKAALGVPLAREGEAFGVINLFRFNVSSFEDRQIELVQTFADQAVIAIENVRLFDEVQAKTRDLSEALTHQTGSANILKVIASSPTDVGPVLKTIAESACELCEAYDAVVRLRNDDELQIMAHHGPIPIDAAKMLISRNWTAGRAVLDKKPVHVHDMQSAQGDEFPEAPAEGAGPGPTHDFECTAATRR